MTVAVGTSLLVVGGRLVWRVAPATLSRAFAVLLVLVALGVGVQTFVAA